ncbi:MAG: ketopantoate reductase family protein [Gammaproteobacteria bacterium]|nr:ketopantoate reductase family protein [Gammaproteobacteria bacterium]
MNEATRYIIYGAGGIGGSIGARLFQRGYDVVLIARGAHFRAIEEQGLRFVTPIQDVRIRMPTTDHPRHVDFRDGDVAILCVKSQHTESALNDLYAAAGDDIPVACCQNGVANERMALRRFRRVYGMNVMVGGVHLDPGEVFNSGENPAGMLDIGCFPSGVDKLAENIAEALTDAGFSSLPDPSIMGQKYGKLVANLGNAVQPVCGDDASEVLALLREEAAECYRVAGIEWIDMRTFMAGRESSSQRLRSIPGHERPGGSSWQSIQRGTGNIETDFLNGEIVQLGRLHGIPTPANVVMQRLGNRVASEGLPIGSFPTEAVLQMIDAERAQQA